ncbi:MAG: hypothetical protein JWP11_650 [Frankiales bacterium]|nr:hypothetical protein [Frankiales bacterium]
MRARRTTTTLLAGFLLPLALTSCGVGLDPQTYKERTTQDATNATVHDLALRDVGIQPPDQGQSELGVGKDAQLTLAIVSVSKQADTLVGVSSSGASAADLVDGSGHVVPSIDVPALGSVGIGEFGVVLRGLTKALRPGNYVDVTFTFTNNGRATLHVPVRVFDSPVPRDSYAPKPAEE